jgi:hypothetical protein
MMLQKLLKQFVKEKLQSYETQISKMAENRLVK